MDFPITRFRKPEPAHRCNQDIRAPEVRLIDEKGEMIGVTPLSKALEMSKKIGLDLVEVSPQASPPVCKILDYGKFKFEMHKKMEEAKKKQKNQQLKEVQIRPNIGQGDLEVKKKAIVRFLKEQAKVKVVMRFRGREMQHMQEGANILLKIKDELEDIATFEMFKKPESRQILINLTPIVGKK